MNQNKLTESIFSALGDFETDFDVSSISTEILDGTECFEVEIKHDRLGSVCFSAKVTPEGDCEMDYCEDLWRDISYGNLFCFMYFEMAEKHANSK